MAQDAQAAINEFYRMDEDDDEEEQEAEISEFYRMDEEG